MSIDHSTTAVPGPQRANGARTFSRPVFLLLLANAVACGAAVLGYVGAYVFPGNYAPAVLSERESARLELKLKLLKHSVDARRHGMGSHRLSSDRRRESDGEWLFSERELSSLLTENTELASRLAIDLSAAVPTVRLSIPVPSSVPLLGGRRIRGNAALALTRQDGRPRLMLQQPTLLGMRLPTAWLDDLQDSDLLEAIGHPLGPWELVADAIEIVEISDRHLKVKLKH